MATFPICVDCRKQYQPDESSGRNQLHLCLSCRIRRMARELDQSRGGLDAWPPDEFAPPFHVVARWLATLPGTADPRHEIALHWNHASITPSSGTRFVDAVA